MDRWPRVIEAVEGSIAIQRCRIRSEAGVGVYAGRTGALRMDGCQILDCRASGAVVTEVRCFLVSCPDYASRCNLRIHLR